jgi:hypothetical protein
MWLLDHWNNTIQIIFLLGCEFGQGVVGINTPIFVPNFEHQGKSKSEDTIRAKLVFL